MKNKDLILFFILFILYFMQNPNNSNPNQIVQKAVDKLMQNIEYGWIANTGLYFVVLGIIFLGMWNFIEPFAVPDKISESQGMLASRPFWHLLFALVIASHFSLFTSIIALKLSTAKLKKYKYDNSDRRKALILAGNQIAIKLIDAILDSGNEVVGLYDKNLNAEGIKYAREKGIHIYSHSADELRKMLRISQSNPKECYYIFIPTENQFYLPRADEIIRSLRKDTKNFRFYRLGIDFDENVNETEIISLLK